MLNGKHILLGVTGSIAAYKAAVLARLLVKAGAQVKTIMTPMAKQFITPLTMATLTKNPILVDFYNPENGDWNSHVRLGEWADLLLIAPATACTLGKMVSGVADNLLITTYLSAKCPVAVAPAMDLDMYRHPSTQENLARLAERGVTVIEPASGELASGLEGKGRMEEPERIAERVERLLCGRNSLAGKKVLITAGPTREAIDPVRYISNYSTGKMGYGLAREAVLRGADVRVISGPVSVEAALPGAEIVRVESAAQMFDRVREHYAGADIVILCAAVADFTPACPASGKIKREKTGACTLELSPTADIAAWTGAHRREGTVLVGFALETDHELENAREKLLRKNLDMIVLNSMQDPGAGFGGDTNKVTLVFRDKAPEAFPLKSKGEVAADIMDCIEKLAGCSEN